MSDNNEEILANFQSITAIEDVGEAIMLLEECNWDLYAAIHRVIPQEQDVDVPPPPPSSVPAAAPAAVAQPPLAAAAASAAAGSRRQFEDELVRVGENVEASLHETAGYRQLFGPDLTAPNRATPVSAVDLIEEYSRHYSAAPDAVASAISNGSGGSSSGAGSNSSTGGSSAARTSYRPAGSSSNSSSSRSSARTSALSLASNAAAAAAAANSYGSAAASSSSSSSGGANVSARVSRVRELTFNINHNYTLHTVRIQNTATVGHLKQKIAALTKVPVCRQVLRGWIGHDRAAENNTTVLRTLNVALSNSLHMYDMSAEGYVEEDLSPTAAAAASAFGGGGHSFAANGDAIAARLLESFTLHIRRQPSLSGGAAAAADDELQLKYAGTQTVQQVKSDVFTITDIPVRHQVWTGWPAHVTGETKLAAAGIQLQHQFTVRSADVADVPPHRSATARPVRGARAAAGGSARTLGQAMMAQAREAGGSGWFLEAATRGAAAAAAAEADADGVIELESDESDFEDATDVDFNADDEMFSEEPIVRQRLNHLIVDNVDDVKVGSAQFVENYKQRYGEPHPPFYVGSLEEAMNEACQKPARSRKLLAIYLHDDRSVLSNVFCDQLLKCDTISQTLQHNFILYGWDVTHESNKHLLLSALHCVGTTATMTVRSLQVSELPTILLVGKTRSTHEVLAIIHGNVSRDELLNKLIDTMAMYGEQRAVEIREENERAARESIKMEQDEAYQESLLADRRKEEEKREREQAELDERRRTELAARLEAEEREAARLEAERLTPAEPAAGLAGCTRIRVRQPNGETVERRFEGVSKLQHLLSYVASRGFPLGEYKLISSYPRRDLTALDAEQTLAHYRLCPQETVILEER